MTADMKRGGIYEDPSKKIRRKFRDCMEKAVRGIVDLNVSNDKMAQNLRRARELNERHKSLFGVSAMQITYGDLDIKTLI